MRTPRLLFALAALSLTVAGCGDSGEGTSESSGASDGVDTEETAAGTTGGSAGTQGGMTGGTDAMTSGSTNASNASNTTAGTDDPGTTDNPGTTAGTATTGNTSVEPTSTSGDTEEPTEGMTSTDPDPTTGGVQSQFDVEMLLSSRLVLTEADMDALTVACELREDGAPYTGDFVSEVTIAPADDVTENGDGEFSFATFGAWTVTCAVDVEGEQLEFDQEIAVMNDAMKPELVNVARGLGKAESGLYMMLRADGLDDQELIDAAATLAESFAPLDPEVLADLDDALVPVAFGYPSPAELNQLGITATPDDAVLAGALTDLDAALSNLQSTLAGIDPLNASEDDLAALEAAEDQLIAAGEVINGLELSTHGLLQNRNQLAVVTRDAIAPAMLDLAMWTHTYVSDQSGLFGAPGQPGAGLGLKGVGPNAGDGLPDGQAPRFGFVSLGLGFVNSSHIQIQFMHKMYGDLFNALDKMINQLILLEVIDYFYDPDDIAPAIYTPYASASLAFALEGYNTKFGGEGFHEDPSMNWFIIIGDAWQETAENAMNGCGIKPEDSYPKKYDKLKKCVKQVEDVANGAVAEGTMVDAPGQLDGYDVHIGPFPEACESFVPIPIGIVPVNLQTGSGPVLTLSCIDNN